MNVEKKPINDFSKIQGGHVPIRSNIWLYPMFPSGISVIRHNFSYFKKACYLLRNKNSI